MGLFERMGVTKSKQYVVRRLAEGDVCSVCFKLIRRRFVPDLRCPEEGQVMWQFN